MPTAFRELYDADLEFVDIARHREGDELTGGVPLPSNPIIEAQIPDKYYAQIAKELDAPRERVAFSTIKTKDARGAPMTRLIGTFGQGENYETERLVYKPDATKAIADGIAAALAARK